MIKRFVDFLKESYLIDHIKLVANFTKNNGKQGEFFQWQVDNAKEIKISPTPKDVKKGNPIIKECWRNSFKVVSENYNKDILYVEGFVKMVGIDVPIEHAWNKMGDIYFDVTSEIRGVKYEEYISIIELDTDKIWEYADKSKHYGSYLRTHFEKLIKKI